jgi:hypothetical protein
MVLDPLMAARDYSARASWHMRRSKLAGLAALPRRGYVAQVSAPTFQDKRCASNAGADQAGNGGQPQFPDVGLPRSAEAGGQALFITDGWLASSRRASSKQSQYSSPSTTSASSPSISACSGQSAALRGLCRGAQRIFWE